MHTKLRILFLHSSSDIYGASKIFLQTITLLHKEGHECKVVLSGDGPLKTALENIGVQVQIINLGILRRQYFNPAGLLNRFLKWRNAAKALSFIIKSSQIDLIYSNTAAVLIGAWVAKKNKIPHYWHLHEIINHPQFLHSFLSWCMRKGADKLITVSDAVSACWDNGKEKEANKMVRVYNGIEPIAPTTTQNLRAQYDIPEDAIVIGLAGRIHVIKGQSYFLDIADTLLKIKSDTLPKLHFLIAGDPFPGQAYLVHEMLAKINTLQLNTSVHYIGMVNNMADFYKAIDVLVVSSILPDSLPTVVLEAMQCSLPVAATAQGGAKEMIVENETGILIPFNNAQMAAEKIAQILPQQIRLAFGAAGKIRVEKYFSVSSFEQNILSIIHQTPIKPLRIAIIGSRGYPYVYSGYETLVKALAERWPAQNVELTVYCHAHLFKAQPAMVNGVRLVYIPTIDSKTLAQPIHSLMAFCHVVFSKNDAVLVLNVSNGPFGIITRLFGKPTMMNVDGLEWLRPKWKGFGATYFKWAAKMSVRFNDLLITDADAMQAIYLKEFGAKSEVITYGAETNSGANEHLLKEWNVQPHDYYLIVGRLIPDNNADIIIEGFIKSNSTKKLVVVGDVPYADAYADKIRAYQDPRLIFTGYVRSPEILASLYKYCFAYMHGHEFGGTNPTLLKAMANGCAIAALDTVFSREVLQSDTFGFYFQKSPSSVGDWFNWADLNESVLQNRRTQIHLGITEKYTWETVSNLYLYHLKALAYKN